MKKSIYILLMMITYVSTFAVYNVGDVVDNFTWSDSNLDADGNIVITERNVYDIIDEGKVLLIDYGFTT